MTTSTVTRPGAAARDALKAAEAPRFVETAWLQRNGIAPDDVPAVLSDLMAEGSLSSCGEGLFANRLARPGVHPNEMVAHFGVRTYASLHTVLGEAGVANNPSRTVYAIRQSGRDAGALDLRLRNGIGEYRLLGMPRDILVAGDVDDRLESGGRYLRATPERALCDWIFLASAKGGRLLTSPPLDLDISEMDRDRLERLALAMGIPGPLAEWTLRHDAAGADADASEQVSVALGF